MGSVDLQSTPVEKDLGVFVDHALKFCDHVLSQRIVQEWNSLSEMTVAATTLNIFKSRLDKQWQAIRYVAA